MRKTTKAKGFIPICVSVTPARHGQLRKLAGARDTSVSAIVNAALDDLLALGDKPAIRKRLERAPLRSRLP
jgi:hypothetical protein